MFPIGDQIDPEIPTDPNELVLYKKYGRNWRDVISGRKYARDRGGNLDRGMRFMHTTPEGFMKRPTPPMSPQQMMQSDIDQSGYMSQMQKMQDDYNRMLQEWYSLTGSSAYQEQQDYYAGNYENMYGGGSGSQNDPYSAPPNSPDAGGTPAALMQNLLANQTAIDNSNTDLSKLMGQSFPITQPRTNSFPADAGKAWRDSQASSASASNDRGGDRIVAKPPAPALVPAAAAAQAESKAPTLNSFIQRYERAEATGNDNPKVKVVAPVKTVVKKSVTPVKVWGNRNN